MNKLFFILFFIPTISFCQDSLFYGIMPLENGKVTYSKIIELDSTSKDQLFLRVKEFAVNFYKSQKTTLETEDKEAGYLVYKGYFDITQFYTAGLLKGKPYVINMYHTLKFYIKIGKMKIVLTDLEVVMHDFASEYISNRNHQQIERKPIETVFDHMQEKINDTKSSKKAEKWKADIKENLENIDKQLLVILNYISSEISKKKSAFDF